MALAGGAVVRSDREFPFLLIQADAFGAAQLRRQANDRLLRPVAGNHQALGNRQKKCSLASSGESIGHLWLIVSHQEIRPGWLVDQRGTRLVLHRRFCTLAAGFYRASLA